MASPDWPDPRARRLELLSRVLAVLVGVAVAAAASLVVAGIAFDVRDASTTFRILGFVALLAWLGAAAVLGYAAFAVRFQELYSSLVWFLAPFGLATLLTISALGFLLFERGPDGSDVVVTLSTQGQAAVARQCGGTASPVMSGRVRSESIDGAELDLELPAGACGSEAETVVIPKEDVLSTRFTAVGEAAPEDGLARLGIEWRMPDRLQKGDPERGVQIKPDFWRIELIIHDAQRPSCDGAEYAWTVSTSASDGTVHVLDENEAPVREHGCIFAARFEAEGVYRVDVLATTSGRPVAGGSATVTVQDCLSSRSETPSLRERGTRRSTRRRGGTARRAATDRATPGPCGRPSSSSRRTRGRRSRSCTLPARARERDVRPTRSTSRGRLSSGPMRRCRSRAHRSASSRA